MITPYAWMVPLLVVLPLVGAGLALAAAMQRLEAGLDARA